VPHLESGLSQADATFDARESSVLAGLIGRNIGASRSPWLHEREAHAHGLTLTYALFDFAALGRDESFLSTQLDAAQSHGYAGVNITYPYKQAVIAYLDELSPGATRVGSVNTVKFAAGKRIGFNTDVIGFAESMRDGLQGAALNRVLQLGAGGGGAATAQALLDLGVGTLLVYDQDTARATALVRKLQDAFGASRTECIYDPLAAIADVDGIVNATPMGMAATPQAPIDTSRDRAPPCGTVARLSNLGRQRHGRLSGCCGVRDFYGPNGES
jgi:shikimate dehydrogenase